MTAPYPLVRHLRLKYGVDLRRARAEPEAASRPYIGLEHIESATGRLLGTQDASDSVISDDATSQQAGVFESGDVLFGKLRPYLAKAWVADFKGRCTPELLVMTPKEFDARFLRYICLSPWFINAVDASTLGSKMPRAEWEFVGGCRVPAPPFECQRAIADFLDRETMKMDSMVAAKERLLEQLAEKRRALVTYAITRGLNSNANTKPSGIDWLGDIPRHWEMLHLKRVLESSTYGVSTSAGPEGAIPVLRMGDIGEGEIDYSRLAYIDEVDASLYLQPGDLLFNRTNSLDQIGKVGLVRSTGVFPITFASYLVRLRAGERVLSEYLNFVLNSSYALNWARAEAIPAIGQANLNPFRYGYLPLPLPPIDEQESIISHLKQQCERFSSLTKATEKSVSLLRERRSALIAAAVTGSIDVEAAA